LINEGPLANLCHVSILPPSLRQKRYCLLYIMGHGPVWARKYVVVWQNGPGSFMLAPGGPGCKSAGPCHLYVKRNVWLAKFLTSRHVQILRILFYISQRNLMI